jgi:hypothetical protein
VSATFLEDAARLALQPALHGIANLVRRRVVRQADVQRESAGRRSGCGIQHHAAGLRGAARIEDDDDRRAEKRQRRAVAPVDARSLHALFAFALLGKLA